MRTKCEACGRTFIAKRKTARFCGDACRKRNNRKPKGTPSSVVSLVPPAADPFESDPPEAPPETPIEGPTTAATRRQLEESGRLETALGVAALIAAMQVDALLVLVDTGSGIKARIEAHRAALSEAVKDAKTEDDPLSKIRAAAALKLVSGGRS